MNKKTIVGVVLFLFVASLGACSSEPDPEYLAYLLSRTQTAMAAEEAAKYTPTPTEKVEPESRCGVYTGEELSVVLYSINPGDTIVKLYVNFPNGVIGKEDGRDDGFPWEYTATIGEMQSLGCDIFEGELYAGRLYCVVPIPAEYRNAAKPFVLRVNWCDQDILSIPMLSLMTEKPMAGSGGGSGASGKLPGKFVKLCAAAPPEACSPAYENWCNCMGGVFECIGSDIPKCDLP
jgi:hypothetical protein